MGLYIKFKYSNINIGIVNSLAGCRHRSTRKGRHEKF